MAHIDRPDAPGILGPMMFRPETAAPLNQLAEVLLRAEQSLERWEREAIAAYVSNLNDCTFCQRSHCAFAAVQMPGGMDLIDQIKADRGTAPIAPKLRALLTIARKVQQSGRDVTGQDVSAARACGASDVEIHDTVLIAAAFCMYNRYVDGLATWAPPQQSEYEESARRIVSEGYLAAVPAPAARAAFRMGQRGA